MKKSISLYMCMALLMATAALASTGSPGTGPAQWRAKFATDANTMHKNIFPGVDLIFSGAHTRIAAQLIVNPGAKLDAIRLDLTGAEQAQTGQEVSAVLTAEKLSMRVQAPQIFQALKGKKHDLAGSFVPRPDGSFGIAVKEYDHSQPLIITLVTVFQAAAKGEAAKEETKSAAPNSPTATQAVGITATKTDQIIPDAGSDGQADPGETIKYTVTIQNSGSTDATAVDYDETVDANTTLTPGTIKMSPLALADSYNTQTDTPISRSISDSDDLLDNDNAGLPPGTIASFGGGTLGGGVTDHSAGTTANVSGHSLTVNADGSFNYSPASGFTGNFTFSYRLSNSLGTDDALVTISVQAPSMGPSAVTDNYFTPVNTTLSRSTSDPDDLLDNDNPGTPAATLTSFGGGSLGGSVTTNIAGASVGLAGGTLTVNSDGSFSLNTPTVIGSFTFQYRLTNSSGTSDATVTIEVRQAPMAVADSYNALVNTTLTINTSDPNDLLDNDTRGFPLANITSFGGGSLPGTVTTNAAGASVALAGGTLTVNSDGSFSLATPTTTGNFTFNYRITNSSGFSDATVTIEVRKAPTAVADSYTTPVNTTLTVTTASANDLLDNDDRGFPLATIINFGGGSLGGVVTTNAAGASVALAGGTLTVNSDGSLTLTTPTVSGSYNFQYRLSNTAGFSDATVTIDVQGAPVANNDPNGGLPANSTPSNDGSVVGTDHLYHTALNTALSVPDGASDLLANDNLSFPAGAISSYGTTANVTAQTSIGSPTATDQGGTVTVLATGSFSYTPPTPTFTGLDQFAYRLTNVVGSDDASVTVAVGLRPAGVADARSATGNVRLSTATNLLTNDTGNQLTVTAFDAASVQGGNVSVAANGTFIYNPPAGYEGSDSFTYTPSNGFGAGAAATVTVTVADMIWFIDNSAVAAGDGRLTSPFNTLAAFEAINGNAGALNPQAGDDIFIHDGSGAYTGGLTLESNQRLIGDGSSGALATILVITLATGSDPLPVFSGTDPTIENAAGNGITLASTNTIRGLTVGNTPTGFGYSGGAVGTFSIQEASKTGTGGAINVSTSGTVGTVQFDNLSSTNAPGEAINLVSVTGTISVTAGTISTPADTAINIKGSNVSMTYPGNITQSNNVTTLAVLNGHTGTLTFQTGTISVTNGNGLQFDNADGTYNFNSTTTLNGGDAGIDILNGSTGTFTFSTTTSITRANGVSGAAFNLLSSNANVTYNGSMTLGTSTGNMVAIDNHDAETMNFNSGSLTKGSSTTQGISIQNSNGGSINFNNPTISITMTSGNAVSLTGNTSGAINFAIAGGGSGMDLATTSGTGFNATGGGTVSLTGSGNTITSTTGTALNVVSTTIGASGLNFVSISSNGGSATGIILDNTGSSGGLTVNGDGSNTTQGGNSSGGTIANKSGSDGATTTGCGIYLNNTSNVVLRRMTINGTNQNHGIRGFLVNGFTLEYSTVNGTQGNSAAFDNYGEGSVYFGDDASASTNGLTGSATVTSCVFSGGRSRNFSVVNTAGTLNRLTITNSNFGLNQNFVDASDNLSIEARNAGTVVNATVTGCTMTGAPGDLFEFVGQTGTNTDLIFQNNTLSNNHAQNVIGGGGVTIATQGVQTFNCSNNTMRDANGSAITLQKASAGTSMSGTLNNNTIGANGVAGSGSATGNGVFLSFAGGGTITLAITNNLIRNYSGNAGIYADNTGGTYAVNLTITGNTTTQPGSGAFAGLAITNGSPGSGDLINVCATITGNDFSAGDPANANDVIVGASGAAVGHNFRLPGYGGTTLTDVQNFINGNNLNPGTTAVTAYTDPPVTASAFVGGAACPTP